MRQVDTISKQIMFEWSTVAPYCDSPSLHYNILASNCGSCPTTTTNTTVTCTDVPTDGTTCTFAVQTVVCEETVGNTLSNQIHLRLQEIRNQASSDCPSLYYNILASNCGSCPTTTTNTTVTCTNVDLPTNDRMCTVLIQAVVFGGITAGNLSDNICITSKDTSGSKCGIAITSTSLLAGISLVYATVLTVLVIVIQRKKRATKIDEQELPDVDDVQDHASASESTQVNTKENIAYGQIMPQANN